MSRSSGGADPSPRLRGMVALTIYVIESDPGVSDALVFLLEQMGREVVSFSSAESFFSTRPPGAGDTVVVNLNLPGISGAQILRWLDGLKARPKLVVISSQSRHDIASELADFDAPTVIRMPITEAQIAACL